MSGEKPGRNLERKPRSDEEDAKDRSVKKPKGAVMVDDAMDDEMEDKGPRLEGEEGFDKNVGDEKEKGSQPGRGRRVVSYMDKVLCLNGDGDVSNCEEDDWMAIQRKEEEEADMDDEISGEGDDDPLCPTFVYPKKQHTEDCTKWRKTLIIKLMGKKIASRFLLARLVRLWSLLGSYEITELDNGHILIKFNESSMRIRITFMCSMKDHG